MKKVSNQHMILDKTLSSDHWLGTMAQVVALGVLLSFATSSFAKTKCGSGEVLTGDEICQTLPEGLPTLPDEPFEAVLKICGNSDTPQWGGACIYEIGDRGPGGGFVFDVTDGGLHGLEAAPEDQSAGVGWGCWPYPIPGADGTAVGTGAQNTADILAECTDTPIAASIAAGYSLNGHNDWFLPSQEELNLMYTNLHQAGLGGFNGYYWSSSESDDYQARARGFNGGDHVTHSKFVTWIRVRAARAF